MPQTEATPSPSPQPSAGGVGILAAFALPHPPLILPAVGRGQEQAIQATIDAYRQAAARMAALAPDTLVVTSPHAPLYRDAFYVSGADALEGDMARFQAPEERLRAQGSPGLAYAITEEAAEAGVGMAFDQAALGELDHATYIPLWFASSLLDGAKVVQLGLSGQSFEAHRQLGCAIARACASRGCRAVLLASGDLSHKLSAEGPYGFAPEGPAFDEAVGRIFAHGDLEGLFGFDEAFCEAAAECGLRSFQIMAGALQEANRLQGADPADVTSELLSLEGPFGVGYAVAELRPASGADDPRVRSSAKAARARLAEQQLRAEAACDGPGDADPLVALARQSVEGFVSTGKPIARPGWLPRELTEQRAGVFVSLHVGGDLRGCIGTIGPMTPCVADEVIANGISACSRDPRFAPVRPEELGALEYSVDVLETPEPIRSPDELDVERYGVIVTQGSRRGLLLPNLEGVTSVAQQVAIAKQKAGINPADKDVELERFEVVRHTRGGEPRQQQGRSHG